MAIEIKLTSSIKVSIPTDHDGGDPYPKLASLYLALQQIDQEFHLDKARLVDITTDYDVVPPVEVWTLEVAE